MNLLVKLATRERPKRALDTVAAFRKTARGKFDLVVSIDTDDASMTTDVVEQLRAHGAEVCRGPSENKVDALNRDIINRDFDVLVVIADDMVPLPGWDERIRADMARLWPNFDGALWYSDGHVHKRLYTIPILGVNLYRKFGYVYHPSYKSLWCDNEMMDVLVAFGRLPYIDTPIIRHQHPSHPGGFKADSLLQRTEAFHPVDEANYKARRAKLRPSSFIGFDAPEISLTIGIPSLVSRAESRERLLAQINGQINALREPLRVEIVLDVDRGERRVGAKRQAILDRAKGRFIAFVDDDDRVADDYVAKIMAAIDKDLEADCVALHGVITTAGQNPRPFHHSILCKTWHENATGYFRTPNHLNPVRTSLARAIGYKDLQCGEDRDYSQRLMLSGKIKRETPTEGTLYYYLFDPSNTATQRR